MLDGRRTRWWRDVALLALAMFPSALPAFGEEDGVSEAERTFRQQWDSMERFEEARDLEGLLSVAKEIEEAWLSTDVERYGRLMVEMCKHLRSVSYGGKLRWDLVAQYSRDALEKCQKTAPENLRVRDEISFVGQLHYAQKFVQPQPSDEEWLAQRPVKLEHWLRIWSRIEAGVDPDWDPEDVPLPSASPPEETGLPAGISPDAIEDAKLRAEYEAAIEANREKGRTFSEQLHLRRDRDRLRRYIEWFLREAYGRPPQNGDEAVALLNAYIKDETERAHFVEIVRAVSAPEEEAAGAAVVVR